MPLDRSRRRGLIRLSLAALLSLAPAAARAAEAPPVPRTTVANSDEIDAAMLRNLDVFSNPDYARDREIAKRLSIFERMRMLDQMTSTKPAREGAATPAEPAKKEVR